MTVTPTPTRRRPRWLVPVLLVGAVVVAVGLALTQPWLLFIDEVADEQLPIAEAPADTAAGDQDDGGLGASDEAADDDATDDEVDNSMAAQDEAMEEAIEQHTPPAAPVVLAEGSFISRDHATSGQVAIVRLEDGSRVLTIEDLQTDNGPDLFVYLDDSPADGPEGDFDDGISLGALRANIGNLVYEIPDDLDLDGLTSVGIWCDRFSSLFGAADLVPVEA